MNKNNLEETTYYPRPYVVEGYALRSRTGEANPKTAHDAAELLRRTAEDAAFTYGTVEQWAHDDVEPTREDYEALCSILAGFSKVIGLCADVAESAEADTCGAPYEMNAAECLEVIERACGKSNDLELCDVVLCGIRDARKALGLPESAAF